MAGPWDRFSLYEACVQKPHVAAQLLCELHASDPKHLCEDFCATAAIARAWIDLSPSMTARAVDIDAEAVARAHAHDRLTVVRGDVLRMAHDRASCDVIHVGNFSIGEVHDRDQLVQYLVHAHARLRSAGLFACDTFTPNETSPARAIRSTHLADGAVARTLWEQREFDPLTGIGTWALSFRVLRESEVELDLADAFMYRWRVRTPAELRECLLEAGFQEPIAHTGTSDAARATLLVVRAVH